MNIIKTTKLLIKEFNKNKFYLYLLTKKYRNINFYKNKKVAIAGFGVSGLSALVELISSSKSRLLEIDIYDKCFDFSLTPYSILQNNSFLLNHENNNMGGIAVNYKELSYNNNLLFWHWIQNNRSDLYKYTYNKEQLFKEDGYVSRSIYGLYLINIKNIYLDFAKKMNIKINFKQEIYKFDNNLQYDLVINATGLNPLHFQSINNSFDIEAINESKHNQTALIIGAGLSAIENAMYLIDKKNFKQVTLHSRTGYLPKLRTNFNPYYRLKIFTLSNLCKISYIISNDVTILDTNHLKQLLDSSDIVVDGTIKKNIPIRVIAMLYELELISNGCDITKELELREDYIKDLENSIDESLSHKESKWRTVFQAISLQKENVIKFIPEEQIKKFITNHFVLFNRYQAPMNIINGLRLLEKIKNNEIIVTKDKSILQKDFEIIIKNNGYSKNLYNTKLPDNVLSVGSTTFGKTIPAENSILAINNTSKKVSRAISDLQI